MTGETSSDDLDAEVHLAKSHARHETSVTVKLLADDDDVLIERKHPGQVPCLLGEGLAPLRGVDAVKPDPDRSLRIGLEHIEGVAVDDADDMSIEGEAREVRRRLAMDRRSEEGDDESDPAAPGLHLLALSAWSAERAGGILRIPVHREHSLTPILAMVNTDSGDRELRVRVEELVVRLSAA